MGKVKNILLDNQLKRESRWYWKSTLYLGKLLSNHRWLYYILSWTWGLFMTLIGFIVLMFFLPFGKLHWNKFGGLYLELHKETSWGFSLGIVSFVSHGPDHEFLAHEFGHTIHNAIFGPFVLLLVDIPSCIRFWLRERYYKKHHKSPRRKDGSIIHYDDIWFEGTATQLGLYYAESVRRSQTKGKSK